MNTRIKLGIYCALAVTLATGASEFFLHRFFPHQPLFVISVASAMMSGLVIFLVMRRQEDRKTSPQDELTPFVHRAFRRITLATEHIENVLLLLQIAQDYNQPVSSGAIHNLMLVEKDLSRLQMDFQDQFIPTDTAESPRGRTKTDSDGRFQAPALQTVRANADRLPQS